MGNILEMRNITKIYSNGVVANKDVNFSVREGEIHALMGENGAGKSTLMKILFGFETMEGGEIYFRGRKEDIDSPSKAIDLGIGMVSQHFMLVDSLKVYENVFLGMMKRKGIFTDDESLIEEVEKYSKKFKLNISPKEKVKDISVGMKQKIEILKVLVRDSKLIILDEPTAVLAPQETEELFEQFLLLKNAGYTIIFITHKIDEVMQICDRATILRNGKDICTVNIKDTTPEEISSLMVGRDFVLDVDKSERNFRETLLKISNLDAYNKDGIKILDNINFSIKGGQILGIAGVDGNGQNELANIILALDKHSKGDIFLLDENLNDKNVRERRKFGLGLIPEDRMTFGIASNMTIEENLLSDKIDAEKFNKKFVLNKKEIDKYADEQIKEYRIKANNSNEKVGMLSGGNIQKVVVARELSSDPQIIIANQPTRGIDIGAKKFVWSKLLELREKGKAVLLISADLNEILELCDSVMVMKNGRIVAYFDDSKNLSEYELGLYMLGVKEQELGENL